MTTSRTVGARTWRLTAGKWLLSEPERVSPPGVGIDLLTAAMNGNWPRTVPLTGTHQATPGSWVFSRHGTADNPYVFHGPATLRCAPSSYLVHMAGRHMRLADLRIETVNPTRVLAPTATGTYGPLLAVENTAVRHLSMFDVGQPISSAKGAHGAEVYGCIILDCGWYSTSRGHGHGMYLQHNPGTTQTIKHNIIAYAAASGIKTAGDNGDASDFDIVGNTIVYPNERDTADKLSAFIHYSNENISRGMVYDGNWSIVSGDRQGYWLGWLEEASELDVTITNAWHHGGNAAIQINKPWQTVTVTDSTLHAGPTGYLYDERQTGTTSRTFSGLRFYGGSAKPFRLAGGVDLTFAEWVAATGATGCTYHPGEEPPARTEVLADDYIAGRAIVRIWNPDEAPTVTVTGPGGRWKLLDALNPEAGPVARGEGTEVTVPMTGLRLRKPAGLDELPHPAPRFGVFLLLPA